VSGAGGVGAATPIGSAPAAWLVGAAGGVVGAAGTAGAGAGTVGDSAAGGASDGFGDSAAGAGVDSDGARGSVAGAAEPGACVDTSVVVYFAGAGTPAGTAFRRNTTQSATRATSPKRVSFPSLERKDM